MLELSCRVYRCLHLSHLHWQKHKRHCGFHRRTDAAWVRKLLDSVHIGTTTHACVTRIAREAAEDFADGVLYWEMRTTPKARCVSVIFISLCRNLLLGGAALKETQDCMRGRRARSTV